MASKSTQDPFLVMESAIKNLIYEISTDEELLLLLRSNNYDPLNDTDATVLRDITNPKKYMTYKGYDDIENDSHRIFLTTTSPTITDEAKIKLFPRLTNIDLGQRGGTSYIKFDLGFEVWIHAKLWVIDGGFRYTQILSRLNKIYNKKHNSYSINTPVLKPISYSYPQNGWIGFIMRFTFSTGNFLVE